MYICSLLPEPPSHLSPHPTPLGWYRAPIWVPQDIQQIPVGCLFYTWWCKFPCYSLHTSHPLLPSHCVHKSVLSVCFSAGGFFTPEAPRKPLSSFSFGMQILGPVCQGLGHDSSTYILCDLRKTLCFSLFTRSKRIILVPTLGLNELVWKAFRMVPSTLHYDHCQPSSYVSQAYYQNKYGLYYNQGSIFTK